MGRQRYVNSKVASETETEEAKQANMTSLQA